MDNVLHFYNGLKSISASFVNTFKNRIRTGLFLQIFPVQYITSIVSGTSQALNQLTPFVLHYVDICVRQCAYLKGFNVSSLTRRRCEERPKRSRLTKLFFMPKNVTT